ncbi:hypothetical protein KKC74_15385 [bacterium]|nr:hypothetical protein [bacterium]MBU1066170.1 hypothetical protein [bacterium]MBU1873459.1 hypothetical protein [bacterium]
MKKWIFIQLIVSLTIVFAQDNNLSKGLGLSAGMISGTGFSYRQMNEKNGFQISLGIKYISDEDDDINTYYFSDGYTRDYNSDYWIPDTSDITTEYEYSYGCSGPWGNLGLTYFIPLHRAKKSLFYTMVGIGTYYSSDVKYSRDYKYVILSDSTYSYEPITDIQKIIISDYVIFFGIGMGIEYQFTENIRMSADLPLTFSNYGDIIMTIPQIGIYYYFK